MAHKSPHPFLEQEWYQSGVLGSVEINNLSPGRWPQRRGMTILCKASRLMHTYLYHPPRLAFNPSRMGPQWIPSSYSCKGHRSG
eukprot:6260000-Amphidinium_carterae.1